jgi:hypothetical protein
MVVARMRDYMKEQLDRAGVTETIGADRFHPTVRAAVQACAGARPLDA